MSSYKQPTVEELKNDIIYLRYIIRDSSPKGQELKRILYYTELGSRPGEIFMMRSYRRPEKDETIKAWIESGQIIKVPGDIIIPWEKDVWLDSAGQVFLLKGYAPWEDKGISPLKNFAMPS
jgi:hypothetical protein